MIEVNTASSMELNSYAIVTMLSFDEAIRILGL